jgi:hypothetical protein
MTFHMTERTAGLYRAALRDACNSIDAAEVAARFAGVEISRSVLELIATAVLGHADGQLGLVKTFPREMWATEVFRDYQKSDMRWELHAAVADQGYVPVALPSEKTRYLKMGTPALGTEVPESADWDTIEISLAVGVRVPPVDRAEAVRRGLLTGSDLAGLPG